MDNSDSSIVSAFISLLVFGIPIQSWQSKSFIGLWVILEISAGVGIGTAVDASGGNIILGATTGTMLASSCVAWMWLKLWWMTSVIRM